tara:strand:+ start:10405 stop:11154 length:750 start_codon:yes stop_codon:yes gene_type:complete
MSKVLICKISKATLYKKPNIKSEQLKEMVYGEIFIKIKIQGNFYYGFTQYDRYYGYIKKNCLEYNSIKNNFLVNTGKAYLYKNYNMKSKTNKFLYFNSRIFVKFVNKKLSASNIGWIKNSDLKSLKKLNKKNYLENINVFNKKKYLWGGNTVDGIDCSGLVQELMKNKLIKCPRDSKDQEIFFKKSITRKKIKKGDLLFWKGHVAIALNKTKCIHAYGPSKKVVKMKISTVISKLAKKSLKLSSIKRPF